MGFSINGKLDTPAQVILAEKPSNDETEQASSLEVEFGDGKKLEIKPGSKFVLDGHSIEVTDLQSKENDTFVLIHKVDGSVGTTEKTATKQEWQTLFEGAYRERRLEI
jgi:GTP-dependent phosphoenolpyruvate carboxykinase